MSINVSTITRYTEEIDNFPLEKLQKYIEKVEFALKNRNEIVSKLKDHTIQGLKLRVVKNRTVGKSSKTVSKALVYKILTTLNKEELMFIESYANSRYQSLVIEDFCDKLKEEVCSES